MQFPSSSLDKLAGLLSGDKRIQLKSAYPDDWELLSRKGVHCYDYMDSMERFRGVETCCKCMEHHGMYNYERLSNVYLLTDVLLLADVPENFRKMSLKTYEVDPVNYFSLPALSWDATLEYTGVKLHLISDP